MEADAQPNGVRALLGEALRRVHELPADAPAAVVLQHAEVHDLRPSAVHEGAGSGVKVDVHIAHGPAVHLRRKRHAEPLLLVPQTFLEFADIRVPALGPLAVGEDLGVPGLHAADEEGTVLIKNHLT